MTAEPDLLLHITAVGTKTAAIPRIGYNRVGRHRSLFCSSSPAPLPHCLPMPFIDIASFQSNEVVPGCRLRTPYGQNLMLSYLEMDDGAEIPMHDHPHEQAGILLRGKLQLTIGDETRTVESGALFIIPPNVPHRALAVDGPVVVLDVFSPIREDYAKLMNDYIPS